jgi:hypothetical protein
MAQLGQCFLGGDPCATAGGVLQMSSAGATCGTTCPMVGGQSVPMRVAANATGGRVGYCTPSTVAQSYAVAIAAASCFAPPPPQAPLPPGSTMCSVPLPSMPTTAEPTCFGSATYVTSTGR